jgi:RHS repeat-associated protein
VHAWVGSSLTLDYAYNDIHQVIQADASASPGDFWHPASGGTVTYGSVNSVHQYPTVGGATYTYDSNENLSGDGTWTYTFDTENHLTSAAKTGVTVNALYDGMHRQSRKELVGGAKTRFIYSGWQRIADYDGTSGALQNRYIYGPGIDEPLIQVSSAGALTFYHADRMGSIIGVSNSSGAVVNSNKFGPFGETPSLGGTTFGFTGQRYDSDLGLYYYKQRYYAPAIGRFLQPDPAGYLAGLNLYTYVNNDPLNLADPFGDITLPGGNMQQATPSPSPNATGGPNEPTTNPCPLLILSPLISKITCQDNTVACCSNNCGGGNIDQPTLACNPTVTDSCGCNQTPASNTCYVPTTLCTQTCNCKPPK